MNADTPSILKALRGDFFCCPFGADEKPYHGETHPPHGETANAEWHFESLKQSDSGADLHLSLDTQIRAGRVDKSVPDHAHVE
jgi:D-hexose-6-phosphate mutarotase